MMKITVVLASILHVVVCSGMEIDTHQADHQPLTVLKLRLERSILNSGHLIQCYNACLLHQIALNNINEVKELLAVGAGVDDIPDYDELNKSPYTDPDFILAAFSELQREGGQYGDTILVSNFEYLHANACKAYGSETALLVAAKYQRKDLCNGFVSFQKELNRNMLEIAWCLKQLEVKGYGENRTLVKLLMLHLKDYFKRHYRPLEKMLTRVNADGARACELMPIDCLMPEKEFSTLVGYAKHRYRQLVWHGKAKYHKVMSPLRVFFRAHKQPIILILLAAALGSIIAAVVYPVYKYDIHAIYPSLIKAGYSKRDAAVLTAMIISPFVCGALYLGFGSFG